MADLSPLQGAPVPAATLPAMPRRTVDPNNPEPDYYEAANEAARAEAAAAELEPMSITEIAEWFGKPPETVRRQWIYERDTIVDPQRRFPLATWPGQNPRWAWRVVKAWGIYTKRLDADGRPVSPKNPPTISPPAPETRRGPSPSARAAPRSRRPSGPDPPRGAPA